jgi:heme iron utilization protein
VGGGVESGEVSLARWAHTLLRAAGSGTLATQSVRQPGFPFASSAPYAADGRGRPVFLFSRLAVHTKNLLADPRAGLMVAQPDTPGDPAAGRVTLLGEVAPVGEREAGAARRLYLARHRDAGQWADFGDFVLYRMEIREVYYVGGFGSMGWIAAADFEGGGGNVR